MDKKEEIKKTSIEIEKETVIIEKEIYKILTSYVDRNFFDIVKYQIKTGGKRMRIALTIASSKIFKGKTKDMIYPCCGIEILHNYSLIIDDIIDDSPIRRGKPTLWKKFGKSIAECLAMYYSSSIFESTLKSKDPLKISKILTKTLKIIVNGEIRDILFEQSGRKDEPYIKDNRYLEIREKDYFDMIGQKTAFFTGSACEIGGICSLANNKDIKKLREFGFNFGMAFQISDDILDIFGKKGDFGKKIGKDIEDRKGGNCVIHFALEEFSLKEKKEFFEILRKDNIKKEDVDHLIKMIKKTKAKEKSLECGEYFVKKAIKNLSYFPNNKWNRFLLNMTESVLERVK